MKQSIIDCLVFPRQYMRSNIDLENCKHAGQYDAGDEECITCNDGHECRWLLSNDECVSLESRSMEKLVKALEFSLEYIDNMIADSGHLDDCQCDICVWLKNAERIYEDYCRLSPTRLVTGASAVSHID
jgi:hypothetical protein